MIRASVDAMRIRPSGSSAGSESQPPLASADLTASNSPALGLTPAIRNNGFSYNPSSPVAYGPEQFSNNGYTGYGPAPISPSGGFSRGTNSPQDPRGTPLFNSDDPTGNASSGGDAVATIPVRPGGIQVPQAQLISVGAGTNTYTWTGETTTSGSNTGPTDPVGGSQQASATSVRVTLRNVLFDGGEAAIASIPVTSSTVPSLPSGQDFLGVWAFDTNATAIGGIDVYVQADSLLHSADAEIDTSKLNVWAFDNGHWRVVGDGGQDPEMASLDFVGGHVFDAEYFAVSAPPGFMAGVPEPTGALMFLSVLSISSLSRRRRRSESRQS